jgi:hypothetical protein
VATNSTSPGTGPTSQISQDDLQRVHEQRIGNLERNLAEARRFIAVNAQQIALIRQAMGLPAEFPGKAIPP